MIGTGENVSGNIISGRERQPINQQITTEFGLERPGVGSSVRASARLRFAQVNRKLRR
jgi:hypothetical protein